MPASVTSLLEAVSINHFPTLQGEPAGELGWWLNLRTGFIWRLEISPPSQEN